jgi:hypothetical protein
MKGFAEFGRGRFSLVKGRGSREPPPIGIADEVMHDRYRESPGNCPIWLD